MVCICVVLRFRGNRGLWALITIATLRVPAAQGQRSGQAGGPSRSACAPLSAPQMPTEVEGIWATSTPESKDMSGMGKPRGSTTMTILGRDDGWRPPPKTTTSKPGMFGIRGWQEERGTRCTEIKQVGRRFCSYRKRSCCSHLLWHKWNGFYFGTRRLK